MPVSEKRRFFYSLLNEAVVATAHQGRRLLLVTRSQFIKCSSILRRSVFFWSSRRPDSAISRHVLHSVCKKIQMDAQAEKKVDQRTGERLKYNDIQGVCHRPHRDGDTLRDPSGEAHQDFLLGFSFPSPSSFFRQNGCVLCVQTAQHARPVSSLIGPVFLSHT